MNRCDDRCKKNICLCSNDQGLFIPNRTLSLVVAGLLLLFFGWFMGGYFLGKKYAADQLIQHASKELIAEESFMNENEPEAYVDVIDKSDHESELLVPKQETQPLHDQLIVCNEQKDAALYYAPLIGYGTEKAAQKFSQKIAQKGISALVKKHTNKTARGKVAHWYQVVTAPYPHDELCAIVQKLEKEERLKGVIVKPCYI